jgi:pimeloyl-ACP methyl ester carboxylesterase
VITDNRIMRFMLSRLLMALCMISLVACSAKTSLQVSSDLWSQWEAFEQQVQDDYPDAVPIVLVHGWNGGEFSWPDPRTLMDMEKDLQRDIYFFNYRTGIVANRYPPLELLEEQLDIYLQNYKQVDIVAHSMGGLLMRQYLSHHSESPVRRVLFLSTPHFGSDIANILVEIANISYTGNIQAEELLPGSDFLWELNSIEGAELDGKVVLNVYAKEQKRLLKGDLVVSTSHAWLPWAPNAEVNGDHHLGRRINEPWAMEFLRSGQLPSAAPVPARKELWLRFQLAGTDEPLTFNDTAVRRFDAGKPFKEKRFDLCCDNRSGLHPVGGTTMILDHVAETDRVKIYPRNGSALQLVNIDGLIAKDWPVQMRIIQLDPAGEQDAEAGMP